MHTTCIVQVGAEVVAENGGVVNKVRGFALRIVAKELGIPFYVSTESDKFSGMFPLNIQFWQKGKDDSSGFGEVRFLNMLTWSRDDDEKNKDSEGLE